MHDVVVAEQHEAELLADIIADGFHDDPVCTWVLNGSVIAGAVDSLSKTAGGRTARSSGRHRLASGMG